MNCDVGKINDYFLNSEADLKKEEHETSEEVHKAESDNKIENEEIEENEKTGEVNNEDNETPKEDVKVDETEETKTTETVEQVEPVEEVEHHEPAEPSHHIELLDVLLNFVDTDNELNYVLAGYFSKLLSNLINKYPHRVFIINLDYCLYLQSQNKHHR